MRNLLLSSLAILGGLTTVHAQHWVPYGFYGYKQIPQKSEPEQVSEPSIPLESMEALVENTESEFFEEFYADPALAFLGLDPQSQNGTQKVKPRTPLCCENYWVEGDYLLAWMKNGDIDDPLITTGSSADAFPGAIGQPGTTVVFGEENIKYHRFQGVRAAIGTYWDADRTFSIEAVGFYLFSKSHRFSITSDAAGNPLIARPFFNVNSAVPPGVGESAEIISSPTGTVQGSSHALTKTWIWGAEANIGYHYCKIDKSFDFLAGFRYLRLNEKIKINDRSSSATGLDFNGNLGEVIAPDTLTDEDEFRTTNRFYGGQIGLSLSFANRWWICNIFGKVGLGVTNEKYTTEGETVWDSTAFGPQIAAGGVLVQPNNMVHREHTRFGWVPEIGVNFSFEPVRHFRILVGYSFLWWNKVIRPGEQIDSDVNQGQIPRDANFFSPAKSHPSHRLKQDLYWLETLNLGVCFDF